MPSPSPETYPAFADRLSAANTYVQHFRELAPANQIAWLEVIAHDDPGLAALLAMALSGELSAEAQPWFQQYLPKLAWQGVLDAMGRVATSGVRQARAG